MGIIITVFNSLTEFEHREERLHGLEINKFGDSLFLFTRPALNEVFK